MRATLTWLLRGGILMTVATAVTSRFGGRDAAGANSAGRLSGGAIKHGHHAHRMRWVMLVAIAATASILLGCVKLNQSNANPDVGTKVVIVGIETTFPSECSAPGITWSFTVTGANPMGPIPVVVDANGDAIFSYIGTNPGKDTITTEVKDGLCAGETTGASGNVSSVTWKLAEKLPWPGDTDGDGCPDVNENLPKSEVANGGGRDWQDQWDYYDINGDGVIDLLNDILGVIQHFQPIPGGAPPYDPVFDRGPTTGPNTWNMTAPDGVIDLLNDILGVITQFDTDGCTDPGP